MPILQRKDRHNAWWVDLRLHGRRIRRKAPVQSLEGAVEYEAKLLAEAAQAEEAGNGLPLHSGSTFAEFAETWMTEYVEIANRVSTVREKQSALRSHLLPAFGGLKLSEITTNIVDAKVAVWVRSGMSVKRSNNLLTILRRSLRCAVEWGLLPQAPIIRHHRYFPPVPKFLTREESWRLVNSMEPGFWRTFVLFLLGTGVRFGEAAALRWEDLDLDSRFPTVTIRRAVALGVVAEPKTRASRRRIALIHELVLALRAHRYRRPKTEWVFTSPSGTFYRPSSTVRFLQRACLGAGVPVITWHKLRHSCATQLLSTGVPLQAIKELLGHTSLEVTSIYAHVAPNLAWEYMQRLSATSVETTTPAVTTFPVRSFPTSFHGRAPLR